MSVVTNPPNTFNKWIRINIKASRRSMSRNREGNKIEITAPAFILL